MKRRSTMTDAFLEEVKNAKADFIKSFSLTKKFLNKLDKKIKEVERREWSSGYCKGRRVENPNWREKNKGKRSGNTIPSKQSLYDKQKGSCNGCKIKLGIEYFHKDHIVPKAKGGKDTETNLQLLCGPCNSLKGTGSMATLLRKLEKIKPPVTKKKRNRTKLSLENYFSKPRTLWRKYKGKGHIALLLTSGKVKYDSKVFPSPFACASYITEGKGVTGLRFWSIKDDKGNWIKLNKLPPKKLIAS